jgi:hypothetical protein
MEDEKKNKADMRDLAAFMLATSDNVPLSEEETTTLLTKKIEEFPPELYEKLGRYLDPTWHYRQKK